MYYPKNMSKYFRGEGEMWASWDPPNQEQLTNLGTLCVHVLDPIREKVGLPIHVSSGFRGSGHNATVGGVKGSQHMLGKAADIYCDGVRGVDLFFTTVNIAACNPRIGGIGLYYNEEYSAKFIHVDIRPRVNGRVTLWYCNADGVYTAIPNRFFPLLNEIGVPWVTIGGQGS